MNTDHRTQADLLSEDSAAAILEGAISIEAALRADSRPISQIYIDEKKHSSTFARVVILADARHVPVQRTSRSTIDDLAAGRQHGGIVAIAGARTFAPLEALLAGDSTPFLAMIDGVEDPFNFGQAVRSLHAAGATGLVLRPRNWMFAAGVVARSSAGATELMRSAIAESVHDAAEFGSHHGLLVLTLDGRARKTLYEIDLTVPILLVIGGEKRGVTRSFLRSDHVAVSIPSPRSDAPALGTAAAAAVAGFEVLRQRMASGPEYVRRPEARSRSAPGQDYTSEVTTRGNTMAHGRDKPKREVRRPKKAKAPKHPAATRDQQVIASVSGQDQHRWTTDTKSEHRD